MKERRRKKCKREQSKADRFVVVVVVVVVVVKYFNNNILLEHCIVASCSRLHANMQQTAVSLFVVAVGRRWCDVCVVAITP